MRARTRTQRCAEFFSLMKLCAGKHFYFPLPVVVDICSGQIKNAPPIPLPITITKLSISFDTLDVMQQPSVSCAPPVTTERL